MTHRKPATKREPRALTAPEWQEQNRFQQSNLLIIAALDAYIKKCMQQGGGTILEVARQHHER
jgi:hypothetical protein